MDVDMSIRITWEALKNQSSGEEIGVCPVGRAQQCPSARRTLVSKTRLGGGAATSGRTRAPSGEADTDLGFKVVALHVKYPSSRG